MDHILKNEPSDIPQEKEDNFDDLNEWRLKSSSNKELRRSQQVLGKAKSAGFAISSSGSDTMLPFSSTREFVLSNISSASSDRSSSSSNSRMSSCSSLSDSSPTGSSQSVEQQQSSRFPHSYKKSLVSRTTSSTDSGISLPTFNESDALDSLRKYKENFLSLLNSSSQHIIGDHQQTGQSQNPDKESEQKFNSSLTPTGSNLKNDSKKQPIRLSYSLNSLLEDKKSDNLSISSSVEEAETSSSFGRLSKPKKRRLINENTEEKKLQIRNSNKEAARRCRDRRRKLIDTLQKDNRQLRDTLSQIAVAIKEHHSQTGCSTLRLDIEHISSLISKSNTTSSGSKKTSQPLGSNDYKSSDVKKDNKTGDKFVSKSTGEEEPSSHYSGDSIPLTNRFLPNTLNHSIWSLPDMEHGPFSRLPASGLSSLASQLNGPPPAPPTSSLFNLPWATQQATHPDYLHSYFPNPTMAAANMYPFEKKKMTPQNSVRLTGQDLSTNGNISLTSLKSSLADESDSESYDRVDQLPNMKQILKSKSSSKTRNGSVTMSSVVESSTYRLNRILTQKTKKPSQSMDNEKLNTDLNKNRDQEANNEFYVKLTTPKSFYYFSKIQGGDKVAAQMASNDSKSSLPLIKLRENTIIRENQLKEEKKLNIDKTSKVRHLFFPILTTPRTAQALSSNSEHILDKPNGGYFIQSVSYINNSN